MVPNHKLAQLHNAYNKHVGKRTGVRYEVGGTSRVAIVMLCAACGTTYLVYPDGTPVKYATCFSLLDMDYRPGTDL